MKTLRLNVETIASDKFEVHSHLSMELIVDGVPHSAGKPYCILDDVSGHYQAVDYAVDRAEDYAIEHDFKFELAKVNK